MKPGKQIIFMILQAIVGNGIKEQETPVLELAEEAATTVVALAFQPLPEVLPCPRAMGTAAYGSRATLILQP